MPERAEPDVLALAKSHVISLPSFQCTHVHCPKSSAWSWTQRHTGHSSQPISPHGGPVARYYQWKCPTVRGLSRFRCHRCPAGVCRQSTVAVNPRVSSALRPQPVVPTVAKQKAVAVRSNPNVESTTANKQDQRLIFIGIGCIGDSPP